MLEARGFLVAAHFLESFGFYLADALASDAEFFAHIFESVVDAVEKAVPHLYNFPFFLRKFLEQGYLVFRS